MSCPRLMDTLDALVPLVGTPDEHDAIDYIFHAHRAIDVARDMIARAPWRCVTMAVDGTPTRWETALDPARVRRGPRALGVRRTP